MVGHKLTKLRAIGPLTLGVFLAFAAAPLPAQAQTTNLGAPFVKYDAASPSGYDKGSHILQIPVRAQVTPACGFATAPNGSRNVGELNNAFSESFDFQIRCSTPSRVGVVSTNGGLLAVGAGIAPGYTALAPYEVALNLAGTTSVAGGPIVASATCPASSLKLVGSACGFFGAATPTNGLRLPAGSIGTTLPSSSIRVFAGSYAGADVLIASTNYSDTLTVTVSPSS
jgi:hypothetical protein